jgi:hypothetical protein
MNDCLMEQLVDITIHTKGTRLDLVISNKSERITEVQVVVITL